jgi:pyrroloquinoline quinone biosynthesis protein D
VNGPDLTVTPRLATKAVLRYDHVRQAHLLLLPERVVRLNQSGASILRLCDGSRTVRDMITELEDRFGATDLGGDVTAFLREARAWGWVVP